MTSYTLKDRTEHQLGNKSTMTYFFKDINPNFIFVAITGSIEGNKVFNKDIQLSQSEKFASALILQ